LHLEDSGKCREQAISDFLELKKNNPDEEDSEGNSAVWKKLRRRRTKRHVQSTGTVRRGPARDVSRGCSPPRSPARPARGRSRSRRAESALGSSRKDKPTPREESPPNRRRDDDDDRRSVRSGMSRDDRRSHKDDDGRASHKDDDDRRSSKSGKPGDDNRKRPGGSKDEEGGGKNDESGTSYFVYDMVAVQIGLSVQFGLCEFVKV